MRIANLQESPAREMSIGHISGIWRDLGREVGTRTIGLRRIEVAAEHFSTPAHQHGGDEEIFWVLAGSGLLWQDGETFAVGVGDCIVHRPLRGAHTLRAGGDGLDVLVFSDRRDARLTALPRAGIAWSFPQWVELPGGENPFAREAAAGAPDCPEPQSERPRNLVALADAPAAHGGMSRRVGRGAGAVATGLNHITLPAGARGAPAHCHSAEEELFVVLDGEGVAELWAGGCEQPEEHALRSGDVFACPAGTGVAHTLRPGEEGVTYLAYGTRDPNDMCFYPESGRVSLRGLGIALRAPEIEYLPR